jgi:hypothetical protein
MFDKYGHRLIDTKNIRYADPAILRTPNFSLPRGEF